MDIYIVYIREAHPTDGWQVASNIDEGVLIADAATIEQRSSAATSCALSLDLSIPILVDTLENAAERLFHAWPERIYILSADGHVVYQGAKGPYGFSPDEAEAQLIQELLR